MHIAHSTVMSSGAASAPAAAVTFTLAPPQLAVVLAASCQHGAAPPVSSHDASASPVALSVTAQSSRVVPARVATRPMMQGSLT